MIFIWNFLLDVHTFSSLVSRLWFVISWVLLWNACPRFYFMFQFLPAWLDALVSSGLENTVILNVPHPFPTTHPYESVFIASSTDSMHFSLQLPGSQNLWLMLIYFVWMCFFLFHFFYCFTLKYISCFCQSFWTNSFDCRRVQVRFVASGSMGRMSPSRQWSWTSPLARGLSGPRTSWTVSYRRSTPSPSRPTTVEKVLMEPTWKNRTSEWNYLFRRSLRLFPSESGLYTDCTSNLTENEKEKTS